MALIEIDGLAFLIAWWICPWRTVNVITRWFFWGINDDQYDSYGIRMDLMMINMV
jgi:nitrogen fixation-related uncharacterized protein